MSGSGKSSAVCAGLLPVLLQADITNQYDIAIINDNWKIIKPYQFDTIDQLLYELLSSFSSDKHIVSDWVSLQHQPEKMLIEISNYLSEHFIHPASTYSLWIIDQYESIFTHHNISTERSQQIFSLFSDCCQKLPLHIITVVRTEYLSLLGQHQSIDTQLPRHISAQELQQIIALQLQYHRLQADSADLQHQTQDRQLHLEARIQNDAIGKPLTSISFLLQKMHDAMIAEDPAATILRHTHYESDGAMDGVIYLQAEEAIENHLSSTMDDCSEHQKHQLINAFFDAFIDIDHEDIIVAKLLANEDITEYKSSIAQLINAFMQQGLIIDCGKRKHPKLIFAHDTLIRSEDYNILWQRLNHWVKEHQEYLHWRIKLDTQQQQWASSDKNKRYLLSDTQALKKGRRFIYEVKAYKNSRIDFILQSKKSILKQRIFTATTSLITLALIAITIWDHFFRVKIDYYAFIGERYSIPFGITPLTKQQVKKRQSHFQLRYTAGKIISAGHYNSDLQLRNHADYNNASRWNYSYTASGNIHQKHSFSQNGKPIATATYEFTPAKNTANISFKTHGSDTNIGNIIYHNRIFEKQSRKKTQITQHRVNYNKQGFIQTRYFYNNNAQPARDASGAYGLRYFYNTKGLITRLEYIDRNNKTISINNISARTYQRNSDGNIIKKSWLGKDENPTPNQQGYSEVLTTYDKHGNLTERRLQNNGKKLAQNKRGFAASRA